MKKHFQQIDLLKGAAIIAVIALHSSNRPELIQTFAIYHIWQAVPVFMVIMGLNLGLGLKPAAAKFSTLYHKTYFTKKATRILLPLLIIFVVSLVLGLIWENIFGREVLELDELALIGLLPVSGRGNYFITLLLQSILVLPIVGYLFIKRPVLTTITLVLLEVLFLLISKRYNLFERDEMEYIYSAALPRYFSALAFGLWLAKAVKHSFNLSILFAFILPGILSIIYLYLMVYEGLSIPVVYDNWATQNVLSFGYAALLILLVIYTFPATSDNLMLRFFAKLGQASYHIFLVQVLYFGLVKEHDNLWLNQIICLSLGFIFYKLEPLLSKRYFSFT